MTEIDVVKFYGCHLVYMFSKMTCGTGNTEYKKHKPNITVIALKCNFIKHPLRLGEPTAKQALCGKCCNKILYATKMHFRKLLNVYYSFFDFETYLNFMH